MNKGAEFWITDILEVSPYERLEPRDSMKFLPGQIYWGPIRYPLKEFKILREVLSERDDWQGKYVFELIRYSTKSPPNIPLKIGDLSLKSDEYLFVTPGKTRPFISLGETQTGWFGNEKIVLGIPIFRFKVRHTQEFVMRIQAFDYPWLFYIKPDKKNGIEEGAARLELIQFIPKGHCQPFKVPTPEGRFPIKLSEYNYKVLWYQLHKFMHGVPLSEELEEAISVYKSILLDKIQHLK